jgi:hypothetical protein
MSVGVAQTKPEQDQNTPGTADAVKKDVFQIRSVVGVFVDFIFFGVL